MKRIYLVLLIAITACSTQQPKTELMGWKTHAANTKIIRDDFGVPHIYGTGGNSFVAVVEFGHRLKAKSMLAGGQSGDPSSPHFADQAQHYADKQFKEVAFYREDVEKRADETYRPGER